MSAELIERLRERSAGPCWTGEIVSIGTCKLAGEAADEIERVLAREKAHMSFNDQQRKEIERLTVALSTALKQGEAEGLRKAAEVADAEADRLRDYGAQMPRELAQREYAASASVRTLAFRIRALLPDEEKPGSGEAGS